MSVASTAPPAFTWKMINQSESGHFCKLVVSASRALFNYTFQHLQYTINERSVCVCVFGCVCACVCLQGRVSFATEVKIVAILPPCKERVKSICKIRYYTQILQRITTPTKNIFWNHATLWLRSCYSYKCITLMCSHEIMLVHFWNLSTTVWCWVRNKVRLICFI